MPIILRSSFAVNIKYVAISLTLVCLGLHLLVNECFAVTFLDEHAINATNLVNQVVITSMVPSSSDSLPSSENVTVTVTLEYSLQDPTAKLILVAQNSSEPSFPLSSITNDIYRGQHTVRLKMDFQTPDQGGVDVLAYIVPQNIVATIERYSIAHDDRNLTEPDAYKNSELDKALDGFVRNVIDSVNRDDISNLYSLTSKRLLSLMKKEQIAVFRNLFLRGLASHTIPEKHQVRISEADMEMLKRIEKNWRNIWPIVPQIEISVEYVLSSGRGKRLSYFAARHDEEWGLILPVPNAKLVEEYHKKQ